MNPPLRRFAHQLWRPGERLPLVLGTAEERCFSLRMHRLGWGRKVSERIRNFAELRERVADWNGTTPAVGDWLSAQRIVRAEARREVEGMMKRASFACFHDPCAAGRGRKTRLQEELGRFLAMCYRTGY